MGNARNNIFVNYMRATEIETKGTSCPQYFTYCCIFSLYIYGILLFRAPSLEWVVNWATTTTAPSSGLWTIRTANTQTEDRINAPTTTCCIIKYSHRNYNRPVQKCNLSDPRRALVYGRFLGILFILSFCHRELFSFK
jgi:hypothetical protein